MSKTATWKVLRTTVNELEGHLNALAQDGYDVFNILPIGASEPRSNLARQGHSLDPRTTFAIVARRLT